MIVDPGLMLRQELENIGKVSFRGTQISSQARNLIVSRTQLRVKFVLHELAHWYLLQDSSSTIARPAILTALRRTLF
jgi:hypothetical protein